MSSQNIGYIRVSSPDQNPSRQLADLELDKRFIEFAMGNKMDRPILQECIDYAREGDTIYIDSIDRLARNLRHLQEIVQGLIDKGVIVKFIKESLTFKGGHDDVMANLMLHLMGAFAEFERNMIKMRMREGCEMAKRAGRHLGRKSIITDELKKKVKKLAKEGKSIRQMHFALNISRSSVVKALKALGIYEPAPKQSYRV